MMKMKDKVLGCWLGLAIGDAMGMPTSFLTPGSIREKFGFVDRFYAPEKGHQYHDGLQAAEVTDDTEQSLALANSFIRKKRVDSRDIVEELNRWASRVENKYASPFGPSTRRALEAIRSGVPVTEAGKHGDTNGGAMRIAPLGIIHGLRNSGLDELIDDVALACLPTHGTQVAISAAASVAWGVACCLRQDPDPTAINALVDEMIAAAEKAQSRGTEVVAPSTSKRLAWTAGLVKRRLETGAFLTELYDFWGCGVASADSVPAAIGIFAAAQGDPARAIPMAASLGGDCDTIAAIAGALAGAFQGVEAIPPAWAEEVQNANGHLDLQSVTSALIALAPDWRCDTVS